MVDDGYGPLVPVPASYRRAQVVMSVCSLVSLVAAASLWLHITYCLLTWKANDTREHQQAQAAPPAEFKQEIDLTLGLEVNHLLRAKHKGLQPSIPPPTRDRSPSRSRSTSTNTSSKRPNPLLILIHNLLLADVFLAGCFLAQLDYLRASAIDTSTTPCQVQGWLVTFAVLVTPAFMLLMGLYTHLATIRGYKLPPRTVGMLIAGVWVYGVVCASLGPLVMSGRDTQFFDRQLMWCWINGEHRLWRLITYVPGYSCVALASLLYGMTFWSLWRQQRSARFMAPSSSLKRKPSVSTQLTSTSNTQQHRAESTKLRPSGHHPAFLMYPFVFLLMCCPLCIGDMFTVLETNLTFMTTTGTLMALSGLVDAIIWSSTIVFIADEEKKNTGLDHFQFIRTPENRTMGNMVWVQGGREGDVETQSTLGRKKRRFWGRRPSSSDTEKLAVVNGEGAQRGGIGIQMETFVTVVVEEDQNAWKRQPEEQVKELEI